MISVCSFQKRSVAFLVPSFVHICPQAGQCVHVRGFCSCSQKLSGVLGSRSSSGREGDPIPKAMLPANVSILENEMSVQFKEVTLVLSLPPLGCSSDPCYEPASSCPSLCPACSPQFHPSRCPQPIQVSSLMVWDVRKEGNKYSVTITPTLSLEGCCH